MPDTYQLFGATVTRKQAIMIVVLGVVLLGVVFFGQSGSEVAANSAETDPNAASGPRIRRQAKAANVRTTRWPDVSIEDMLNNNPFAASELLQNAPPAPPVVEAPPEVVEPSVPNAEALAEANERDKARQLRVAQVMAEFQNQKVKLILRTDKKASAVIGDRLVHEGDVIDGVRIVSILPDSVLVEPTAD